MRMYAICIDGLGAAFPKRYLGDGFGGAIWGTDSQYGYDTSAQQIEFQIEELRPNLPTGDPVLTVHGVSFEQIVATGQLIGKPIRVYGGMHPAPALPLSVFQSRNRGLLMDGQIIRAWGNWVGTEMSIGMAFAPAGSGDATQPGSKGGGSPAIGSPATTNASAAGNAALHLHRAGYRARSPWAVRSKRVGARSIDSRPFAQGVTTPQVVGMTPTQPQSIGQLGEILANTIGAATTTHGNVKSSFFGGGSQQPLAAPINFMHNMQPGQPLGSAIQETLQRAFPAASIRVAISPNLVQSHQDSGTYSNFRQYAKAMEDLSHSILGPESSGYYGAQFSTKANYVDVWDFSQPIERTVTIDPLDLIGQPTWIDIAKINIKTVLRGDIMSSQELILPPNLLTTIGGGSTVHLSAGPLPLQRARVGISGKFYVTKVRHVGDFRNPDGVGWSTDIECIWQSAASGQNQATKQNQSSSAVQNPFGLPTHPGPPTEETKPSQ
jgi:hypothetical protein